MGKHLGEAMRGGWLSTGIQVVVLAAVLLAIASFSFRFHPHSGPLNLLGYSLILVAAGSIALSPRWPVAAVGVALGATLISHGLGFESSPIDLADVGIGTQGIDVAQPRPRAIVIVGDPKREGNPCEADHRSLRDPRN